MEKLNSFVLGDGDKCIGCKACELACHFYHNASGLTAGNLDSPVFPKLFVTQTEDNTMPVQCHHCEEAPCFSVCLEQAIYFKDDRVLIDTDKCKGCKDCLLACPFGAVDLVPFFNEGQVVLQTNLKKPVMYANKCDLCNGREAGPICIEVCPQKALRLVNPNTEKRSKNTRAIDALANMFSR